MLTNIRKLSEHFVFKFFSFLIILSFVSWGVSDILRDKSDKSIVTFKNEKPILTSEFTRAKQERIKYIQNIVKSPISEAQMNDLNIDKIVLDSLINDRIFSHMIRYYELGLSDENIIGELKKDSSFTDQSGKFNYEIFHNILRRNGISESNYLSSMKKDIASKIILKAFDNHSIFPSDLSEQIAKYLNYEILFDVVEASPNNALSHVLDEDIKNFYEKNKSDFITEELRDIEYIEISPNLVKVNILDEEIKSYYEQNIEDYNSKAIFSFYDITLNSKEGLEKVLEALKASNYSIIKDVTGKDITKFFKENIKENNIDIEILKLLKSKEPINYIEINGEYHILKKEIYIPAKLVELKDARKDIELILSQRKFESEFSSLTKNIDDFVASAENLEVVAKKFGLELKKRNNINKSEGDKLLEKAWELSEGDFSEVFELDSGSSCILFVRKTYPSRQLKFEEAKANIKNKLQKEAAIKELHAKLNNIKEKGTNFIEDCKKANLNVILNKKINMAQLNAGIIESYPRGLIVELFSINKGELSSVFEFDGKIYLAKLKDKSYGKYIQSNQINSNIQKNFQSGIIEEIILFLRKDSGMKIKHSDA